MDSREKIPPGKNLWLSRFATPLGEMIGCADESGLIFLHWADAENKFADSLLARAEEMHQGDNAVLAHLREELNAYFSGKSAEFHTKLHMWPHSAFRQKIWQALQAIPAAATHSYGEMTANAGFARNFTRAAANAIGQNPFLLLVPCHRVIGADGSLTGYHGGLPRKQALLAHEQRFFGAKA